MTSFLLLARAAVRTGGVRKTTNIFHLSPHSDHAPVLVKHSLIVAEQMKKPFGYNIMCKATVLLLRWKMV